MSSISDQPHSQPSDFENCWFVNTSHQSNGPGGRVATVVTTSAAFKTESGAARYVRDNQKIRAHEIYLFRPDGEIDYLWFHCEVDVYGLRQYQLKSRRLDEQGKKRAVEISFPLPLCLTVQY